MKKTRIFDGKVYRLDAHGKKSTLIKYKNKLKASGWLCRIIKVEGSYHLYRR